MQPCEHLVYEKAASGDADMFEGRSGTTYDGLDRIVKTEHREKVNSQPAMHLRQGRQRCGDARSSGQRSASAVVGIVIVQADEQSCGAASLLLVRFAATAINEAANGASTGQALKAGAIGGAIGAAGAVLGVTILQPALGAIASPIANAAGATAATVQEAITVTTLSGGLFASSHSAGQGDYTGLIGLGLSIGIGLAWSYANGGGAAGRLGRAGGENENVFQQLGDHVDLAREPKQQVLPGSPEYARIEDALKTIPNRSVRGESLQRLAWGDYYTYDQRWGAAEALTTGTTTYVPTTSLDFDPYYLGHQLAHEHFHVLQDIYAPSWFAHEAEANRFTASIYESVGPGRYRSSQEIFFRSLGGLQ